MRPLVLLVLFAVGIAVGYWIGSTGSSQEVAELRSLCDRVAQERDQAVRIMETKVPTLRPMKLPSTGPNIQ